MTAKPLLTLLFFLGLHFFSNAQETSSITLTVDMTNETVSSEGVFVVGNFFNGTPELLEDNGDGTWSYTLSFTQRDSLFYLFQNGTVAEELKETACLDESSQNRWLVVPETDEVINNCYNYCVACDAITTTTNDFELKSIAFKLFPNPMHTHTLASWEHNKTTIATIDLITSNGQLLRTYQQLNDNQVVIEKGALSSGIYFLKLTDEIGRVATQKLFVQ